MPLNFLIPSYGRKVLRRAFRTAKQTLPKPITHVETQEHVAALTFDDGPDPEYTPRLLDILKRHRAKGTFFMIGEAAAKYPEIVRRAVSEGHALGNHSWNHPQLSLIGSKARRKQILACEQVLAPYGHKLFRPPYGQQSIGIFLDARILGYKVVFWSVDVGDWWDSDPSRMARLLLNRLHPGCIIVLHDRLFRDPSAEPSLTREPNNDRLPMLQALDEFLGLDSQYYHFITIPELLRLNTSAWKSALARQV